MAILNPPAWLQFRTDHPAALYRRQLKGLLGGGTAVSGITAAGDLAVTAQTTPNMTVRVAAGGAFINGTESTALQGTYHVHNDASVTLTVAAADPSLARYDLVVLRVRDQEYSGTTNDAALLIVQGTPAAAPAEPAAGANSIVLARLTVGAGATTITSSNIVDRRSRAVAAPLVAASTALRDAMNVAREGQLVFRSDLDELEMYDGAAWRSLDYKESDTGWLPVGANSITIATGWVNEDTRIRKIGNEVWLDLQASRATGSATVGPGNITDLHVATVATAYAMSQAHFNDRTGGGIKSLFTMLGGTGYASCGVYPAGHPTLSRQIMMFAVSEALDAGTRVRAYDSWRLD